MKTTIINWEIAHENAELSDYMEASGIEDILEWFEGAPDQLRIGGETVLFIDIPVSKTHTVVVYRDGSYSIDENEIVRRLTDFYSDDFKFHFNALECLSSIMKAMTDGICYRGGKGYNSGSQYDYTLVIVTREIGKTNYTTFRYNDIEDKEIILFK